MGIQIEFSGIYSLSNKVLLDTIFMEVPLHFIELLQLLSGPNVVEPRAVSFAVDLR